MKSASQIAEQVIHLSRAASAAGTAEDLTPAQWAALRFGASANRLSATPGAFARFHGVTKGAASQILTGLTRRGLLEVRAAPGDGRRRLISLTPAGRAALVRDPAARLGAAIAALAPAERAALASGLTALSRQLAAPPCQIAIFGLCEDCAHRGPGVPPACLAHDPVHPASDRDGFCGDFMPAGLAAT